MNPVEMTVYVTDDPEMIAAMEEWSKGRSRYSKDLRRAMRDLGVSKHKPMVSQFAGMTQWDGITVESATDIPVGWRLDRKVWMLVPYKSTKEGKQVAARMAQVRHPRYPELRGMLRNHMAVKGGQMYLMNPSLYLLEGRLYAKWNLAEVPETGKDGRRKVTVIDRGLWDLVRPSEFMRLLEDQQQVVAR